MTASANSGRIVAQIASWVADFQLGRLTETRYKFLFNLDYFELSTAVATILKKNGVETHAVFFQYVIWTIEVHIYIYTRFCRILMSSFWNVWIQNFQCQKLVLSVWWQLREKWRQHENFGDLHLSMSSSCGVSSIRWTHSRKRADNV